ncbi:ABC transporter permease [Sulfurirhabdus autotrophica]|uniref:Transport permease protein n=1 Tax=Sulfurirhabdus autotrophica TaxID=1706046 RepID=A0A4R3XUH4_9PROT|nr:ABC transporter permease [Sulfurirhabdus autotrophica]TCV79107.1 lipopolysaccharide transport system permease protein [Sulfurirhabdus autotrophica]
MSDSALNLFRAFPSFIQHQYLIGQLIKRDVLLRYRGAFFGVLWVFLSPLLMLGIFAFVFGSIFQSRWPQQNEVMPFWLLLYCGLIVFNLFAETISRAPGAVRGYPSYVKKIIFPVHILPLIPLGAAFVHTAFNIIILFAALAWTGHLHLSILLFPFLLFPTILLALGLSWFLAAWGVFIKDMTQIVPVFVQMLMFLSPIFYPINAVPALLQPIYQHNPLGAVIEAARAAATGQPIDWSTWGIALAIGLIASILGFAFFQHSREEFADVL